MRRSAAQTGRPACTSIWSAPTANGEPTEPHKETPSPAVRRREIPATVTDGATQSLIREVRESFVRLQTMVIELHPTDEADPARAEIIANLKRELESTRG